ncbi:MAG: MBL fold metallo-hydrolase [Vicinamibacterales bacterium]
MAAAAAGRVVLAGLLLLTLASAAVAQAPVKTAELTGRGLTAADFPRMIELAPNVFAYSAVHVQGVITTNSLIVITTDGVVVVDGQGTEAQVERMVADIRARTSQPIRYVVMGSNHGDHTGGYAAFPSTATVIAHPTAQAAMQRAASQPARGGGPSRVVVPTETVSDSRVLTMGGTEIRILFLGRSHTGGDLVVHLPAQRIVFMSETYLHRMFPSVGGGYPSEWIDAIGKAQQLQADVYVPGHGFVDDPATLKTELAVFRRALETLRAEGRRLHAAGVGVDDAPARADFGEFADWSLREAMAPAGLRRVYTEVDGGLR